MSKALRTSAHVYWVALSLGVQDVAGSNLGPEDGCGDSFFTRDFPHYLQVNAVILS